MEFLDFSKSQFFLPQIAQIDKNNLLFLVFLTVQIFVLGTLFTTDTIRFHVFTEMFISSCIVNALLTEGKFIMATLIYIFLTVLFYHLSLFLYN